MKSIFRLTAVAALLASGSLSAQESIGTVLGTARDGQGNLIANARVQVEGAKILLPRVTQSNEKGEFRIPLLPAGDYVITVTKDGYVGSKATLYLGSGQILRQEFSLREVKVTSAEVEVVATAAAVDKTDTKTSTSFDIETLQALPTGSLNSYGALTVAPGVTGSVSYPNIRGAAAGQSAFMINGISAKDTVVRQGRQFELVLDDLTEDIAVVQSPLNARYGNTSGGLVNLVTKTGTNTFEGSIRVKLSKDSWNALYPRRSNRDGSAAFGGTAIQSDTLTRVYEIAFSGPIIKDHLTFTYGTKLEPRSTGQFSLLNVVARGWTGSLVNVPANTFGVGPDGESLVKSGEVKSSFHTYKLFWMINPGHQVEFFQTINIYGPSFDTTNFPGTFVDPNSDFFQKSDRNFYGVNYRGVIGDSTVVDFVIGNRTTNVKFASGPGDPISQRVWWGDADDPFANGLTLWDAAWDGYSPNRVWTMGTNSGLLKEERNSRTISLNVNTTLNSHGMDFGFSQLKEEVFLPEAFGPNSVLFYSPQSTADGRYLAYNFFGSLSAGNTALARYMRNNLAMINERRVMKSTGDPTARATFTTNSIYANDLWTLNSHWSIMGGLRYDQWQVKDRLGERVKTSGLSPRVEVKWDLFGNNQHLFSFTGAIFTAPLSYGGMGGSIRVPGNIIQRNFWNNGSPTVPFLVTRAQVYDASNYTPYTYTDSDYERGINPDLKPEQSRELTLNYRKAFSGGGYFRASAIYRSNKDMLYLRGENRSITLPNPDVFGTTYSVVPTTFKRVLEQDPYGKREHRGLEFEWSYPLLQGKGQSLVVSGNWTMNRDFGRDPFRDGNVGDNAVRWDAEYASRNIPMDVYNPEGSLPQSIHDVVKAWMTWTLGSKGGARNILTLLGTYQSGTRYSMTNTYAFPTGMLVTTETTPSAFTAFYNGRGGFGNPETFFCDLQWNLTFPATKRVLFTSYLTIGNVFNTIHTSGMNRAGFDGNLTYPTTNYSYRGAASLNAWGINGGNVGARSINVDLGIKF